MPEASSKAKSNLVYTLLPLALVAAMAISLAPMPSRAEQGQGRRVEEGRKTGWLEWFDTWIGDQIDKIQSPKGTSGATRALGSSGDDVCLLWPSPFYRKDEGTTNVILETPDPRPTITSTAPMSNIRIQAGEDSDRPVVVRRGVGLSTLGTQMPWPEADDDGQVYLPLRPKEQLTIEIIHMVDGEPVESKLEIVGASRERMGTFRSQVEQAGDDPDLWKQSIVAMMNESDSAMVMAMLMHADRPSHQELNQAKTRFVRHACPQKNKY